MWVSMGAGRGMVNISKNSRHNGEATMNWIYYSAFIKAIILEVILADYE
jgi:hypothetical protein